MTSRAAAIVAAWAVLSAGAAQPAPSPGPPASAAQIRELLEQTGAVPKE